MELHNLRYSSEKDTTRGLLFDQTPTRRFLCYTLEDEHRDFKVPGETRIPAGHYRVTLRTEGGFHNRYSQRFPDIHQGMLWIRDVPEFEYVLIHVGNTEDDTAGCLLVGNEQRADWVGDSVRAYRAMYLHVITALIAHEPVFITFEDWA